MADDVADVMDMCACILACSTSCGKGKPINFMIYGLTLIGCCGFWLLGATLEWDGSYESHLQFMVMGILSGVGIGVGVVLLMTAACFMSRRYGPYPPNEFGLNGRTEVTAIPAECNDTAELWNTAMANSPWSNPNARYVARLPCPNYEALLLGEYQIQPKNHQSDECTDAEEQPLGNQAACSAVYKVATLPMPADGETADGQAKSAKPFSYQPCQPVAVQPGTGVEDNMPARHESGQFNTEDAARLTVGNFSYQPCMPVTVSSHSHGSANALPQQNGAISGLPASPRTELRTSCYQACLPVEVPTDAGGGGDILPQRVNQPTDDEKAGSEA